MILLDTTFLVHALRKNASAIQWLKQSEVQVLCTSEVNVFELYAGLYKMSDKSKLEKRTAELEQLLAHVEVLPFNRAASIESAKVYCTLMDKGTPIGPRDVMIAGTALARGITRILTGNVKEFQRVPGLTVETY